MVGNLNGVEAKLARADTHFDAVKSALQQVIDPEPHDIPGEYDSKAGEYIFRSQRDSPDPAYVSPVIGDCVHNMRAALDYLVWELVRVAGNTGTTKTEFPIFTKRAL